jgi:hypothetical protein
VGYSNRVAAAQDNRLAPVKERQPRAQRRVGGDHMRDEINLIQINRKFLKILSQYVDQIPMTCISTNRRKDILGIDMHVKPADLKLPILDFSLRYLRPAASTLAGMMIELWLDNNCCDMGTVMLPLASKDFNSVRETLNGLSVRLIDMSWVEGFVAVSLKFDVGVVCP